MEACCPGIEDASRELRFCQLAGRETEVVEDNECRDWLMKALNAQRSIRKEVETAS